MKKTKTMITWMSVLLMLTLTACSGASSDSDIDTIVAQTLEALTQTAPQATEAASAPAVTANVEFENISFYLDPQVAASMSYEITAPPEAGSDNPFQQPSQYRLNFVGVPVESSQGIGWREPRLYVIPVENMQSFPGGAYGAESFASLQQILSAQPASISSSMPILPYNITFNNGEEFHSNLKYLNFQNGSGVRFVAEFSQTAVPLGRYTSYIFQGITSDGQNFVSLTMPVNTTALDEYNAPYVNSIADQTAYEQFSANYESYKLGAVAILETAPDASFTPDLSKLDALIESLLVRP